MAFAFAALVVGLIALGGFIGWMAGYFLGFGDGVQHERKKAKPSDAFTAFTAPRQDMNPLSQHRMGQ